MNTSVWLIEFTKDGKKEKVAYTHNAIVDFRSIDPKATVCEIDCAEVPELIEAIREYLIELRRPVSGDGAYQAAKKRLDTALARIGGQP